MQKKFSHISIQSSMKNNSLINNNKSISISNRTEDISKPKGQRNRTRSIRIISNNNTSNDKSRKVSIKQCNENNDDHHNHSINPIFELLKDFELKTGKIWYPYLYKVLLNIHFKNDKCKLKKKTIQGMDSNLTIESSMNWLVVYKKLFLEFDNDLGISQGVYLFLLNKAKEMYTRIKKKIDVDKITYYLEDYVNKMLREIDKRNNLSALIRRIFKKKKRLTLSSSPRFRTKQSKEKFFFTKNLLKTFAIDEEIEKQRVIIERDEALKKMTEYFIQHYTSENSMTFSFHMNYYQKKLGIKEPLYVDNKQPPISKKLNEEILNYREYRKKKEKERIKNLTKSKESLGNGKTNKLDSTVNNDNKANKGIDSNNNMNVNINEIENTTNIPLPLTNKFSIMKHIFKLESKNYSDSKDISHDINDKTDDNKNNTDQEGSNNMKSMFNNINNNTIEEAEEIDYVNKNKKLISLNNNKKERNKLLLLDQSNNNSKSNQQLEELINTNTASNCNSNKENIIIIDNISKNKDNLLGLNSNTNNNTMNKVVSNHNKLKLKQLNKAISLPEAKESAYNNAIINNKITLSPIKSPSISKQQNNIKVKTKNKTPIHVLSKNNMNQKESIFSNDSLTSKELNYYHNYKYKDDLDLNNELIRQGLSELNKHYILNSEDDENSINNINIKNKNRNKNKEPKRRSQSYNTTPKNKNNKHINLNDKDNKDKKDLRKVTSQSPVRNNNSSINSNNDLSLNLDVHSSVINQFRTVSLVRLSDFSQEKLSKYAKIVKQIVRSKILKNLIKSSVKRVCKNSKYDYDGKVPYLFRKVKPEKYLRIKKENNSNSSNIRVVERNNNAVDDRNGRIRSKSVISIQGIIGSNKYLNYAKANNENAVNNFANEINKNVGFISNSYGSDINKTNYSGSQNNRNSFFNVVGSFNSGISKNMNAGNRKSNVDRLNIRGSAFLNKLNYNSNVTNNNTNTNNKSNYSINNSVISEKTSISNINLSSINSNHKSGVRSNILNSNNNNYDNIKEIRKKSQAESKDVCSGISTYYDSKKNPSTSNIPDIKNIDYAKKKDKNMFNKKYNNSNNNNNLIDIDTPNSYNAYNRINNRKIQIISLKSIKSQLETGNIDNNDNKAILHEIKLNSQLQTIDIRNKKFINNNARNENKYGSSKKNMTNTNILDDSFYKDFTSFNEKTNFFNNSKLIGSEINNNKYNNLLINKKHYNSFYCKNRSKNIKGIGSYSNNYNYNDINDDNKNNHNKQFKENQLNKVLIKKNQFLF